MHTTHSLSYNKILTLLSQTKALFNMTIGNLLSNMGIGNKQVSDRFEYQSGPPSEHFLHYGYEAPLAHNPIVASKHNYGGGHKSNAAMSALTLLAFLFFLNILQQCLKDQMTSMTTPQFMVMTGGREGDREVQAKTVDKTKMDKTGLANANLQEVKYSNGSKESPKKKVDNKVLTKVQTSNHVPKTNGLLFHNNSLSFPGFVSAMYKDKMLTDNYKN